MIKIEYITVFILYIGFALATTLLLWLLFELKAAKKKQRSSLHELIICEYCHFPYLKLSFHQVSRCPQCQSYNKKELP